MDRNFFNYKRELKQLFSQFGGDAIVQPEQPEERDQRPDLQHYSKKQRRILLMQEKMQNKQKALVTKKQILVQPNAKNWPRIDPTLLRMERTAAGFTFVKSVAYRSLQKEFAAVQQTNDINALIQFLQRNFYHHESLVYFADFLRIQGRFSEACDFLERCLLPLKTRSRLTFALSPGQIEMQLL